MLTNPQRSVRARFRIPMASYAKIIQMAYPAAFPVPGTLDAVCFYHPKGIMRIRLYSHVACFTGLLLMAHGTGKFFISRKDSMSFFPVDLVIFRKEFSGEIHMTLTA